MSVFERYKGNPILKPNPKSTWDSYMVFNAAAILLRDKIHLLYRARGRKGGISKIGYASTKDGFHLEERLDEPVFEPEPGNEWECLGCEDPRLTKIEDTIYLLYTAYGRLSGMFRPIKTIQVGMTSISSRDFALKN